MYKASMAGWGTIQCCGSFCTALQMMDLYTMNKLPKQFFRDLSVSCNGDFWQELQQMYQAYGAVKGKQTLCKYIAGSFQVSQELAEWQVYQYADMPVT